MPAAAVAALLSEESDAPARLTAPPSGLFLERVLYKGDAVEPRVRPATPLAPTETRVTRR